MILAAVTQRRVEVPGRGSRDCLNRAWPAFLAACGVLAAPVPGDPGLLDAWLERVRPEAVILSGGNAAPGGGQDDACPERDRLELALIRWAGAGNAPLLGVCRGAQMLNAAHGGGLRRLPGHTAVAHALSPLPGVASPAPLPAEVNSFHDYSILAGDLGRELKPLALGPAGAVEFFVHERLPLAGLLWHPERFSPFRPEDVALVRVLLGGRA